MTDNIGTGDCFIIPKSFVEILNLNSCLTLYAMIFSHAQGLRCGLI
uniref:Uncharacterized protein n=1 Tax=Anguilla anguilla TaxID=7936 RepID=A0A0E9WTW2_ANGAN